jgi:hypothetical protein
MDLELIVSTVVGNDGKIHSGVFRTICLLAGTGTLGYSE